VRGRAPRAHPCISPTDLAFCTVLLLDNFRAHYNSDALREMGSRGYEAVFLPANTTAGLQPLDVSINKAFKSKVRTLQFEWRAREYLKHHTLEGTFECECGHGLVAETTNRT